MKSPKRDTNVFSISALDLFCSAMGVFMVLCFVTMPFYGKTDEIIPQEEPQPIPEPTPKPNPKDLTGNNKSIVAILTWSGSTNADAKKNNQRDTPTDMDMHIFAPDGRGGTVEYSYSKKVHEELLPTRLVLDDRGAALNEIWVAPEPIPGKYTIVISAFDFGETGSGNPNIPAGQRVKVSCQLTLIGATSVTERKFDCNTWEEGAPYTMLEVMVDEKGRVTILNQF